MRRLVLLAILLAARPCWAGIARPGTGTTPGGSSGALQYNNAGAFGGASITGIVKGNGASAPTAAVAGTDYVACAPAMQCCKACTGTDKTLTTSFVDWASCTIPQFSCDPGTGVTTFRQVMSAVVVDGSGTTRDEVTYQMTGCGFTDTHAIPANAMPLALPEIVPAMVGYAVPAADPLGTASCVVHFQAKQANVSNETVIIKGQQITGNDESCALVCAEVQ